MRVFRFGIICYLIGCVQTTVVLSLHLNIGWGVVAGLIGGALLIVNDNFFNPTK